MKLKYVTWIIALVGLRLLSLIPSIIDDDEAWFSASARALSRPFDFYIQVPDNKPPGTVWFYSLFHGDPQLARLASIALIILAAFLLGQIAYRVTRSEISRLLTAGLVICTSAIFPKLCAVTNEGLILILSSAMLSIWAMAMIDERAPSIGLSVLSGLLMAGLFLIKQTSLVYLAPVVYSIFFLSWKKTRSFLASAISFGSAFLLFSAIAIVLLQPDKYLYWNFTYATTVLTAARSSLFSEGKELCISLVLIILALWPLLWRSFKRAGENALQIYVSVWFLSAFAASLAGWGLFLHYFIPLAAPLSLACGLAYAQIKTRDLIYVSSVYAVGTLLFLFPYSGSFWGTDLLYYQSLSKEIENQTQASDRVFIWGGNAIPLALTSRGSLPGFLTSRFSTAPYSTTDLESQFETQIHQSPPALFVDLHERHDNRFGTSPLSIAWLKTYLEQYYVSYQSPSVPWVTFYRLSKTRPAVLPRFTDQADESLVEFERLTTKKESLKALWKNFSSHDLAFRTWESLELLEKSHPRLVDEKEIAQLNQDLRLVIFKQASEKNESLLNGPPLPDSLRLTMLKAQSENAAEKLSAIYLKEGLDPPLPLEGRAWWISFAIKNLQPQGI